MPNHCLPFLIPTLTRFTKSANQISPLTAAATTLETQTSHPQHHLTKTRSPRKMATIDTSLLPNPTGRAAALAAQHAGPQPLQLYGGWFCPFVQRAWIVLAEK